MKNPKFWWALIVFLIAWSFFEIYPPTSGSLVQTFAESAVPSRAGDAAFKEIVTKARELQKAKDEPQREFGNLIAAIGTNDIQAYFPMYDVKAENNPTYSILNHLQKKCTGKIKLGLDLQGGSQFQVSLNTSALKNQGTNAPSNATVKELETKQLTSQAVEVLRRRVDRLGVAEPVITPAGNGYITIQLPGLSQAAQDEARNNIQKAAVLTFRMVHKESARLIQKGIVEPGYEVMNEKRKNPDGTFHLAPYLIEKRVSMTGKHIKRAMATRDPISNMPVITFSLDSEGRDIFGKLTSEHVGEQLAIVLDGVLYSAPVINGPILGGNGEINGTFDVEEAITLANALENPLETPVRIEEMRQVDPTLGKDTISSGINSAFIGTLAVMAFMILYYHRCGAIASIAMITNLIILLGVMCGVGTTLTLPGIAGVVLTVGMAVDANVLIYERLREEMALGKSMRGAIAAAYSRAFGTIFDSHSTTLISSIILIYMGTGPVKGFGVTLTIGVALSLFTALVVTRLIFDFLLNRGWLNKIGMLDAVHLFKKSAWDFMKFAKPAFITSWAIIVIGVGFGAYREFAPNHGGFKSVKGIDFAGGDTVTYEFKTKVEVDKLRKVLEDAKVGETHIQYQKGADKELLEVITAYSKGAEASKAITNTFNDYRAIGHSQVGASVGTEIQASAFIATFLSLFGILIYVAFRYEFSFSVGAVLAVIHDVLMTVGIFFLWGGQFSAPVVASILTIIGFSINDTIVIFDRIREDLKLGVRGTFVEVMNKALNQTLSRTIITSGTVFIATLSLFLFGGAGIHDFAFTFLVGIITGTYSSIYIASALVLWWHKGERPKMGTQVVADNPAEAAAPRA